MRFAVRPSFENVLALVHDVSPSGIGFLIDRPLERGASLVVQLRGGPPGCSLVRTAKVMHVRRALAVPDAPWVKKRPFLKAMFSFLGSADTPEEERYIYLVGCRVTPPMSPSEIEALCGPDIIG